MTELRRETNETTISLSLTREGGDIRVTTGDRFLTHMVETFARYAGLGLELEASGDLRHHLVEDVGIALGLALRTDIPDTATRYGSALVPMHEALVQAAVDVGGRPYYVGPCRPSSMSTSFRAWPSTPEPPCISRSYEDETVTTSSRPPSKPSACP